MIWLALAAHAADPTILAVLPFTLAEPEPAGMLSFRPSFDAGALLVLRVDPATRVPSQGPVPQWWVGDQPARSWGFDPKGGCAVFLVEGSVDLASAPVFVGPAELPERLDAATAARRLADAKARGARPLPAAAVAAATEPVRRLAGAGDLNPLADERMAACTGSPPPAPPASGR